MFAVSSKVVVLRALLFWVLCEAFFALTTPLLVGWMGTPEKGYGELLHEYLRGPEMYLVAAALCAARLPSLTLQAYRKTGTATPWVYLALILGANASLVMAAAPALVFAEYEPEPGSGRVPASHAPNISASSSSVARRR
ncbi:hypothetical protein AQJ27_50895 [Streptomyces olivochromogenes]|nr:hypothetical protein AQJ27_50895 [Streptomyces olivochromogenes]